MDAFYSSVEVLDQPQLAGRPVVVGGTPQARGVVAAASYAARRFGVRSAMPMTQALRLCPPAVVLPVRMSRYAEVSQRIHTVLGRYTPLVEPLALDEAFLDVTASRRLFGTAEAMGRRIKADIHAATGLVASVGVAPNKFVAKIASDIAKPDGFVVVQPDAIRSFLDPLPVGRLWGVGGATERALERLGIRTIGQLRRLPAGTVEQLFGKHGAHLAALARGVDERPVVAEQDAKSVSNETTFAADLTDDDTLRAWLQQLAEQVGWRLRRAGLRGRTVQLKVRFADFTTLTRASTLPRPTDITDEIWRTACTLFATRLPRPRPPVRLLGVGVSGFGGTPGAQGELFGEAEGRRRAARLDAVMDRIRQRFGRGAARRGRDPKAS